MPMKESAEDKEAIKNEFNLVSEVNRACKKLIRFFITIDPKNYCDKTVLLTEYRRDKSFM